MREVDQSPSPSAATNGGTNTPAGTPNEPGRAAQVELPEVSSPAPARASGSGGGRFTSAERRDFILLVASRIASRLGDGFLRILGVLLVAAKSKDPMLAGLVLVSRYVCEALVNAVSGPVIDRVRIRTSLITCDLLRAILAALLIVAVLSNQSYWLFLALSFLGDLVFVFFKPAADKVVKVTVSRREATRALSIVDAANHSSNIGGFMLASLLAGLIGLHACVLLGPLFFLLSLLLVFGLKLPGEAAIDYAKDQKKSYWVRQREGLAFTWSSPPLRLLLIGRSLDAVARGSFAVLSVAYLAGMSKGLAAYGYFESAQSVGKVIVTALVIPLLFAYRSTFLLTGVSLLAVALSFFGLNMVDNVTLACIVGVLVGAGQAGEAVGLDSIINRFAGAHIQGRAKSTTSFGSRIAGLGAIAVVYLLVTTFHVDPRSLFAYLGIFPILAAGVFLLGWMSERGSLATLEFPFDPEEPATLELIEGNASATRVELSDRPVMIGRSRRNDVVIEDDRASRFHAAVRFERGRWLIEDLKSANGVFVDGVLIASAVLAPGNQIMLGRTTFRFNQVKDSGPAAPAPKR